MVFRSAKSKEVSDSSLRRYHVVGLDIRCENLFHSMMKLVEGKTSSKWVHDPAAHDLLIIGAESHKTASSGACQRSFTLFTGGRGMDCALLKLASIVEVLEDVEAELKAAHLDASQEKEDAIQAMQLTRWPSASLLAARPDYPKLATLMLARPVTLADLVRLSGVDERTCAGFVSKLSEAGLLRFSSVSASSDTASTGPGKRLFAMIRERLGLKAAFY